MGSAIPKRAAPRRFLADYVGIHIRLHSIIRITHKSFFVSYRERLTDEGEIENSRNETVSTHKSPWNALADRNDH